MMPPLSLEQIRARHAYAAVAAHPEVVNWSDRLPTMLQVNGLLSTWAHLLAKSHSDPGAHHILTELQDHLLNGENPQMDVPDAKTTFIRWVGQGDGHLSGERLRRLSEEALAYSSWLKRAGQAAGGMQ